MLKKFKKIVAATAAIMMMASTFSMWASAETYNGYEVIGSTGGFKYLGSSSYVGTFHNRITKGGLYINTTNGTASSTNKTTCKVKNISYVLKNKSTGSKSNYTLANKSATNSVTQSRVLSTSEISKYVITSSTSTHNAYGSPIIKGVKTKKGSFLSYNNL